MKPVTKIFLAALFFRILFAVLAFNGWGIKDPAESIVKVHQRSAYLYAAGYGYSQTIIGSPAYIELETQIDAINAGKSQVIKIQDETGIYPTMHYPPAWAIIAGTLYKLTGIRVLYCMLFLGILADMVCMWLIFAIMRLRPCRNTVINWALWIYALFPPVVFNAISIGPDSLITVFILGTSYCFIRFFYSEEGRYPIVYGLATGLLTGVCALFRSDFALLPFFLVTAGVLLRFNGFLVPAIKFTLAVAITGLVILLPWGFRNKTVFGKFSVGSSALGGTLVTGMATIPNPWKLGPSDLDRFADAKAAGIQTPFENDGNQFFMGKYKEMVSGNHAFFVKILVYRTVYFFLAPFDWGINTKTSQSFTQLKFAKISLLQKSWVFFSKYWSNLLSVLFSISVYLSAFWLLIKYRTKDKFLLLLMAVLLYVYSSHLFLHMALNYIMPVIGIMIIILFIGLVDRKQNSYA